MCLFKLTNVDPRNQRPITEEIHRILVHIEAARPAPPRPNSAPRRPIRLPVVRACQDDPKIPNKHFGKSCDLHQSSDLRNNSLAQLRMILDTWLWFTFKDPGRKGRNRYEGTGKKKAEDDDFAQRKEKCRC